MGFFLLLVNSLALLPFKLARGFEGGVASERHVKLVFFPHEQLPVDDYKQR